jgi:hypothetical protein
MPQLTRAILAAQMSNVTTEQQLASRLSVCLEDATFAPLRENYCTQIWAARHAPRRVDTNWLHHDENGYFFVTQQGQHLKVFIDHHEVSAASPQSEHLHILLDQSGSMAAMQDAVYAGVIEMVEALPESATATLSTFASTVTVGACGTKAVILDHLRTTSRLVSGLTSLYDGIVEALGEAAPAEKNTVVIVTDGYDTASRRTRVEASAALGSFRSKTNHRVLFLGSNQNAIESGRALGVPAECALTFGNEAPHALAACRAASDSICRRRSGGDGAFRAVDRSSAAA